MNPTHGRELYVLNNNDDDKQKGKKKGEKKKKLKYTRRVERYIIYLYNDM